MKQVQEKNTREEGKLVQRKTYHSPKLSNFGTVAVLTQAMNRNFGNDGSPDSMSMSIS